MKKSFEIPAMTVIAYEVEDVITTSNKPGNNLPEDDFED